MYGWYLLFVFTMPLLASYAPPFFSHYSTLQNIPYCQLGDFPTPVHVLDETNKILGTRLYIKRDDLSGKKQSDGKRAYGGNKIRKLEFLLADALASNAKTIITFGCAGSNHALATSLYAHALGLKCTVLLKPQPNAQQVQKNLLYHQLHGTELLYYKNNQDRAQGTHQIIKEVTERDGIPPYIIPTGGSCPRGVLGFVKAAFEL